MLYIRTVLHIKDVKSDQIILATRTHNKIGTRTVLGLGIIYLFGRFSSARLVQSHWWSTKTTWWKSWFYMQRRMGA